MSIRSVLAAPERFVPGGEGDPFLVAGPDDALDLSEAAVCSRPEVRLAAVLALGRITIPEVAVDMVLASLVRTVLMEADSDAPEHVAPRRRAVELVRDVLEQHPEGQELLRDQADRLLARAAEDPRLQ